MRQDETVAPVGRHPHYIQLVLDQIQGSPPSHRPVQRSHRAGIGIAVAASMALAMVGVTLFAITSRSEQSAHRPTTESTISPPRREKSSEARRPAPTEPKVRTGGLTATPDRVIDASGR